MNFKNYILRLMLFVLVLSAPAAFAQTVKSNAPRQEKLLNGLKLLIWNDPTAAKASVKLRVHSGAAFDTLGKEGTMAMLADAMFPNASVKEFFGEELGGSLDVETDYDYIQISTTGDSDKILTILETLAAAVTKPPIDKETTARIRAARLERIKTLEADPSYVADRAVAQRLFGNFPYGRSADGTSESLAKIDFADLLLAKQRFLTADNATIAVSGNVKSDYVFKAVRQLFGGWEKADKKVPATFAQPDAPDATALVVKSADGARDQARFAFRGTARNDRDFWAAAMLAQVLGKRFGGTARQNPNLLPGAFNISLSNSDIVISSSPAQMVSAIIAASFEPPIKPEEFTAAREAISSESNKKAVDDYWLDVDTYKLASVKADTQAAQSVVLADVQRMAEKFRREPMATVLMLREKTAAAPKN